MTKHDSRRPMDNVIKAAWIGGTMAIAAAVLGSLTLVLLTHATTHNSAAPHPTVTITKTVPVPAPSPHPDETIEVAQPGSLSVWSQVAAAGTTLAGMGTIVLGTSAVMSLRRRGREDEDEDADADKSTA
jgi:hypothetical protein